MLSGLCFQAVETIFDAADILFYDLDIPALAGSDPKQNSEIFVDFFHLESGAVQASLLSALAPLCGLAELAPERYAFRYNVPHLCALYHSLLTVNTFILIAEGLNGRHSTTGLP